VSERENVSFFVWVWKRAQYAMRPHRPSGPIPLCIQGLSFCSTWVHCRKPFQLPYGAVDLANLQKAPPRQKAIEFHYNANYSQNRGEGGRRSCKACGLSCVIVHVDWVWNIDPYVM
jgi:hypothetical protein